MLRKTKQRSLEHRDCAFHKSEQETTRIAVAEPATAAAALDNAALLSQPYDLMERCGDRQPSTVRKTRAEAARSKWTCPSNWTTPPAAQKHRSWTRKIADLSSTTWGHHFDHYENRPNWGRRGLFPDRKRIVDEVPDVAGRRASNEQVTITAG